MLNAPDDKFVAIIAKGPREPVMAAAGAMTEKGQDVGVCDGVIELDAVAVNDGVADGVAPKDKAGVVDAEAEGGGVLEGVGRTYCHASEYIAPAPVSVVVVTE